MNPVFSTEDEISSCIEESWEEKHSKPPKDSEERPSTPPKLKRKEKRKKPLKK